MLSVALALITMLQDVRRGSKGSCTTFCRFLQTMPPVLKSVSTAYRSEIHRKQIATAIQCHNKTAVTSTIQDNYLTCTDKWSDKLTLTPVLASVWVPI